MIVPGHNLLVPVCSQINVKMCHRLESRNLFVNMFFLVQNAIFQITQNLFFLLYEIKEEYFFWATRYSKSVLVNLVNGFDNSEKIAT